jgi:hypothetical protein
MIATTMIVPAATINGPRPLHANGRPLHATGRPPDADGKTDGKIDPGTTDATIGTTKRTMTTATPVAASSLPAIVIATATRTMDGMPGRRVSPVPPSGSTTTRTSIGCRNTATRARHTPTPLRTPAARRLQPFRTRESGRPLERKTRIASRRSRRTRGPRTISQLRYRPHHHRDRTIRQRDFDSKTVNSPGQQCNYESKAQRVSSTPSSSRRLGSRCLTQALRPRSRLHATMILVSHCSLACLIRNSCSPKSHLYDAEHGTSCTFVTP